MPAQRRVRKVRSLADCPSLRLSSVYLHYLSSSSPVLYTSAKEYVPVITEQDNLSAFIHLIRGPSTPTRASWYQFVLSHGIWGNPWQFF